MMGSQISVLPAAGAVLGMVLVVGTTVEQAGHSDSSVDFDPMGGMDMSGVTMPATDMPPANAPGADTASSGMTGMDTSGTAVSGMNMDDPAMAAAMPGGFHATCTPTQCTVIFARTSTGTAAVLGMTARLAGVRGGIVSLVVGKHAVTLHRGRPVLVGRDRAEFTDSDVDNVTVVFTRR